ncbi:MAG TPA: ABC-type transport auxiliary lipoprotein family protein [Burkholderiales bacterium]|jgi:cholesterol transport system auxiliary component|nr:ABC-type transport auxiliary lipoprotein family protein [Burkholderiales bacterium]
MIGRLLLLALGAALVACAARTADPVRTYDFGLPIGASSAPAGVHVRPVQAPEWLDRQDMLYRLAYRDSRVLEPYAAARWAGTPPAMLTLKLRQALGESDPRATPCVLSVELEEFSQVFDAPDASRAVLFARASLREAHGQRRSESTTWRLERAAPTADAAGGAAAFSELASELTGKLREWIVGLGYCR